jgi:hypothetical protein
LPCSPLKSAQNAQDPFYSDKKGALLWVLKRLFCIAFIAARADWEAFYEGKNIGWLVAIGAQKQNPAVLCLFNAGYVIGIAIYAFYRIFPMLYFPCAKLA